MVAKSRTRIIFNRFLFNASFPTRLLLPILLPPTSTALVLSFPHTIFPKFSLPCLSRFWVFSIFCHLQTIIASDQRCIPDCRQMNLIPKTIGNRKRDFAWGCTRGINTTCKSKSTNQSGERNERLPDLCFSICRFSQVVFIPQAQPHAQSLFLFPIVFGINLIHFFDEEKNSAAGNSIVCFGASIPCHAIWQKRRRMRTVSKSAKSLATESVSSAPFKRGVRKRGANFSQGKVKNFSPTQTCTFWQVKVQNPSPISALLRWRHLHLSLYLSLSLSLSLCISLSLSLCISLSLTSRTI